ncbi:hypothetical protein [Orientia tsutsugamushi]|uniref:Ankyrin repeat protein with 1d ankyrin repeats n=1 Tax=Orientia tsutsugamushi (strain Boryong) TaxID=357244 RepID=A5CEQ9_ORITB|nr:hypothetical protein [Orientia tsutsugamushi]CAM80696.1 ankyrin repeat protein with 1d ankyrin repeats [Orientia tsutsugamushi str. Boryong]
MISDEIRREAFGYVQAGNKAALLELTALHPKLVYTRSQANNDTLLIRAFKYLREDIIEALLILEADISAKDEHGMPATMWIYDTKRTDLTTEEYDNTALRISKKYLSLDEKAKLYSDDYTNLLLNSTKDKFPVHYNDEGYDHTTILTKIIQRNLVQSAEWFIKNFQLNQNEIAESLIAGTIRMSSGNLTSTEVRKVELFLEKHLSLIDENSKCANNLAEMLFQRKFYEADIGYCHYCFSELGRLQSGQSIGHHGAMIYNDIHVLVAKMLIKFGIDLKKYESYVESLISVHDNLIPLFCRQINVKNYKSYYDKLPSNVKELLESEFPAKDEPPSHNEFVVIDDDSDYDEELEIVDVYDVFINTRMHFHLEQYAVILESTKKKMLQLTKVSSILSKIKHTKDYEDSQILAEDLPITIDVVLNRIDYLRKKDNAQESDKQEIEALSNFISNKIILSVATDEEAIDVCNNFIEYFMNKCNSKTRFEEFLNENMLEDKANKALKFMLYQTTEDSFKTNISSLATKIIELTNGIVLPFDIDFLNLNDTNSKIVDIDYDKQILIKNNLKVFSSPNTYRLPNVDKLEELSSEYNSPDMCQYYKNHLEAFNPISMLLEIAHDEDKLSEQKQAFSNDYANIKSKAEEQSSDPLKLTQVMSKLTHITLVIDESLNLCMKLSKYLNISPLKLLLKEYQDKYALLSEEYNNVLMEHNDEQGVIGDIEIESSSIDL